ncbi:MAG: hypothetical protein A3F12_01940 [Gammaproteobacteria bacterium RIFCSPHIGHO2_12_FULL_38_14]|nr:MAG: hypothetical protein A3F12_01940 [Gammaproteobacteria bacterium RIFCSPHIGHO2_12_FULL_38_14]
MLKTQKNFCYYLFSLSNLLAAFGGGTILGKGVGIIDIPYLQGGSILAFFVGTVIGLVFLQFIPKKISQPLARWFSICGGITSLILVILLKNFSDSEKLIGTSALIFFILLSVRFSFWFYSRVLRAANAAGQQQNIAWVELGYYSGMIIGLIIWNFLGINIAFSYALIIDALLQFSAGILDIQGNRIKNNLITESKNEQIGNKAQAENKILFEPQWGWRLAISVVFLTIAAQVIIFNLAHHVAKYSGSGFLATFYFGVAVAAYVSKKYNLYLQWNTVTHLASVYLQNSKVKFSLFSMLIGLGISIGMVVLGVDSFSLDNTSLLVFGINTNTIIIYSFIFIAAFLYEIHALILLDRLGLEEKNSTYSGMVMRTYGLMGIGAAISLWLLNITNSTSFGLMITLVSCLIFAGICMLKRDFSAIEPLDKTAEAAEQIS